MKKIIFGAGILACALSFALSADIEVKDAFAKATPPTAKNSAAFMTIYNNSNKDISLISATNSVSNVTELHTHIEENGMKKMVQVPKIEIKANSSTQLKPGGLHIMFMGIKSQLNEGDSVDMSLKFDNGEVIKLEKIPVKLVKPMKMHH